MSLKAFSVFKNRIVLIYIQNQAKKQGHIYNTIFYWNERYHYMSLKAFSVFKNRIVLIYIQKTRPKAKSQKTRATYLTRFFIGMNIEARGRGIERSPKSALVKGRNSNNADLVEGKK